MWGRSWLVEAGDGRKRVLKLPYEAEDLPPAAADRVPLMRACAEEQADLLHQGADDPLLVTLEDRITLPSGATALLLPHHPTTLQRQLRSGVPLTEALHVLQALTQGLATGGRTHGNLRPSNVLIGNGGQPVLADLATPSMETLMVGAEKTSPARRRWSPPERLATDTWAICQALFCAASTEEGGADDGALPPLPAKLDKLALADLREHAEQRLKHEGANRRFVTRTAERLATLLGRGLSKETDPSPPYRFLTAGDLAPRLTEVVALVDPSIESVGKLLLSSAASGSVFNGPGPVGFTVSVAPTEGVQDAEDVVCGVRLTDLDTDERVPIDDAQFTVDRHASGRLRYAFDLPDVAPGRYEVRVAFSIKDSGHAPAVAEGTFEVRPPPGYVPPAKENEPKPLDFPGNQVELAPMGDLGNLGTLANQPQGFDDEEDDEEDMATVIMAGGTSHLLDDDTDPGPEEDDVEAGGEVIDAFPRPLAPSGPGTAIEDDEPEPEPAPPPPVVATPPAPSPPPLAAVPTPPPSDPSPTVPTPAPVPSSVVPQTDAAPSPAPVGSEGPGWAATQEGESEFFAEAPLPGDGALPGMDRGEDLVTPASGGGIQARLLELTDGDPRVLYGAAIAGCLLLVLVTAGLLRACS